MTGDELRKLRTAASWTQQAAAQRLGVTQAYLSMVERGVRLVSADLLERALETFAVRATALPLGEYKPRSRDERYYKEALGSIDYPGFRYLANGTRVNPALLLMQALDEEDLDARVAEALPWLPVSYSDLDWEWLTRNARLRDRQNRLAYLLAVAGEVATMRGEPQVADVLSERKQTLEASRLASEDTLCEASMTQAERRWLRTERSQTAAHWNLLTDLKVEHLDHAFH